LEGRRPRSIRRSPDNCGSGVNRRSADSSSRSPTQLLPGRGYECCRNTKSGSRGITRLIGPTSCR
jgi:hypothetical protein